MTTQTLPPMEKTIGTDYSVVNDVMEQANEHESEGFIPGDTFSFPGLGEKQGLKFIEAKAEKKMPSYDEDDEDIYEDFDAQIKVTIHAETNVYGMEEDSKNVLFNDVESWLKGENDDHMKIINKELVNSEAEFHVVHVTLVIDAYCLSDFIGDVQESSFTKDVWNKHMEKIICEGVCYVKDKVLVDLRTSLLTHIDALAEKTPVDYHPKSNSIVRDLVHPALYPYIKGVSKMIKNAKLPMEKSEEDAFDFWGRKYEDSKFQWMPTPFKITNERKCKIQEYINNLDKDLFPDVYQDLEALFEVFLPYFEEVWSYANAVEFFTGDDDDVSDSEMELEKKPVSFTGKELQIIVKIVEYSLQPDQSYEGVWHAEGMSHENIVMTGIYFLDRNANIEGGDLRFKRAFTAGERSKMYGEVPQSRPAVINDFASEGFIPLGHFPTEEGYLLVFPNCHIHKIAKMVNSHQKEAASRRIVVFFVVNPDKKIVSTREVPPQQNISLSAAKDYRLELMAERKYDKEKLNVRDIELCEH
eukprot:GFUD01015977.1.p1 GENE.GFUD01015977.1~~GFUD01015977.1.p1  ORF type:complete len:527 (+),score=118.15 GFUD01015977.1:171-1751(+)